MSQLPPTAYPPAPVPYAGPSYTAGGYGPAAVGGSTSARRAGTAMFILGPLTLLGGGCLAGMARLIPRMSSSPQLDQMRSQWETTSQSPFSTMLAVMFGLGVVVVVAGLALLVLAPFVFRGRRWAIITALVLVGPMTLVTGLQVLGAVPQLGSAQGLLGGCVLLVATAGLTVLLVWLIAAVRRPTGVPGGDAGYQQYVAQWYQYQQAAQAYAAQSAGYGYGVPPPMSPPPPSVPPAE